MIRRGFLPVVGACAMVAALHACGGDTPSGGTPPTTTQPPITAPTPTPTPNFSSQCGLPSPPPLYGMKVSVQVDNGFRKLVDSRPVVENVGRGTSDSYCGRVGFDSRAQFCDTRPEGNPQRPACDALVTGRATDTGRYGPTWEWEDRPCGPEGSGTAEGCVNHTSNQFLVIARGEGALLACASSEWPATGARCGGCDLKPNVGTCLQ